MLNLKAEQERLEAESLDLGVERYRKARERGEVETLPGGQMLKRTIGPLTEAIEQFLKDASEGYARRGAGTANFLSQFEPDLLAFLTLRHVLNGVAEARPLQGVALGLASQLEDVQNFEALKRADMRLYKKLLEKIKTNTDPSRRHVVLRKQQKFAGIVAIKWEQADKLRAGTTLIHLCLESTGLIEVVHVNTGRNRTPQFITVKDEVRKVLEEGHARCELLSPVYLPMVCKPREWSNPFNGGYLTPKMRFPLIKTANRNYLEELKNTDLSMVYKAVNALQGTSWRINTGILNVLREVWDGGGRIGKLPQADNLELPPRDFSEEEADEGSEKFKMWKMRAARVYDQNFRMKSKRIAVSQKVWLAEKYSAYERFHFVYSLDWRGRVYPTATGINPQGDDSSKALLEFADGMALGAEGAYWLAIHGANSYGVDKVSFTERAEWVQENHERILESALNPLDGTRWWADADSPYMFLAFCKEWAGLHMHVSMGNEQDTFVSHLPIGFDGSCNGLQNFAALLRDEVGGAAVGLIPAEKPADVYSDVARAAQRLIDVDVAAGHEVAQKWAGRMVRKFSKRNTMTVPYGVSRFGMSDQLRAEFKKLAEDNPEEPFYREVGNSDFIYIAGKNYEATGEVVQSARAAMNWLQEAARIASASELPVWWKTPSGLPVLQAYRSVVGKRFDFDVVGQRYRLTLAVDGTKLDKKKQAAGISPNFVHSLDAAHLMRTVSYCVDAGMKDFAMIHDSYGAHAGAAATLNTLLRQAFIDQYTPDVLADFRDQLEAQLPEGKQGSLPPLPKSGSLELSRVMDSDYFFA